MELVEFLNNNAGVLSIVLSGIVMIATVVYAKLTFSLVDETRRMREVQTEPTIEIVALPMEESIHFFTLRVRNIGLGPAYDVQFKLAGETNSDGENELIKDFTKSKFLEKGLKYLGSGQELHSGYTQINKNFESKIAAHLIISVTYRSATNKIRTDTNQIYFDEYTGYGKLGTPHLYAIAQSLKKIEQNFDNIATGFKRLQVNTYSGEDRNREDEEWEKQQQEFSERNHQKKED